MLSSSYLNYNNHVVGVYVNFKNEPKPIPNNNDNLFLYKLKQLGISNIKYMQNVAKDIEFICNIIKSNNEFNDNKCDDTIKDLFPKDFIQHFDSLIFMCNYDISNVEYGDMTIYHSTLYNATKYIDYTTNKLKVTKVEYQPIDDLLVQINYNLLFCKKNVLLACKLVNKWLIDNNYCDLAEAKSNNATYDLEIMKCNYLYTGNKPRVITLKKKKKNINVTAKKINNTKK